MAYIPLVRIAPGPWRRVIWLLPIAALALSAVVVFGCGSDGEESTTTPTRPTTSSAATGSGDDSVRPSTKGSEDGTGGRSEKGATAKRPAAKSPPGTQDGKGRGGPHGGAGPPAASGGGEQGGGSRTASSDSGRCPAGVSRRECEAIAEQVSDTPSYSVSSVEDCVKAIGKEGCERLLETETASQGGSPSIDVNECLKNPTPPCEAALRPILEGEQAASNAKK